MRERGIHDTAHRLSGRTSRPVSGLAGEDATSSGTTPSHALGTVARCRSVDPHLDRACLPLRGQLRNKRTSAAPDSRFNSQPTGWGSPQVGRMVAEWGWGPLGRGKPWVNRLARFVRPRLPVGAHPVRDSHAWMFRSVGSSRTGCAPTVDLQLLAPAPGSWLLALRGPRMTRRAGGGIARRVAGMDAGQFVVRAGCPVDKPRNPSAHLEGRRPGRRVIRGALLFGYFSLGKQRKVTRPPAGGRKPAAGGPGRGDATAVRTGTGFLLSQE